jgi:hypothetical protein
MDDVTEAGVAMTTAIRLSPVMARPGAAREGNSRNRVVTEAGEALKPSQRRDKLSGGPGSRYG